MDTGMDMGASAMAALQNQPVMQPQAGLRAGQNSNSAMDKAANEFESVFVSQFLGAMFSGIKTDGITGGGQGEEMFRSLMVDQYANSIQKQGGLGLAAGIKAQMLKMQEM